MKAAKIILWDDIEPEGDFTCPPFHPEARETDVCQFRLPEPSLKTFSVAPMQVTIAEVSPIISSKLPRIEL
jgi:hypothetical protein